MAPRKKVLEYKKANKIYTKYCQINNKGELITSDKVSAEAVENFAQSKGLASVRLTAKHNCKLVDAYRFKTVMCCPNGEDQCSNDDKGICCQAITKDGTRCERKASKWTSLDLTKTTGIAHLPQVLINRIGKEKSNELMLLGSGLKCCFYCWQHVAMYAIDGATWTTNFAYYTTHPEDILDVFYEDVKVKKRLRILTYSVSIGKLRSTSEIISRGIRLKATTKGVFSTLYWILQVVVFAFNSIIAALERLNIKNPAQVGLDMAEKASYMLLRYGSDQI